MLSPSASLDARAVVKYAPALCRAVVMFDANPHVIALPTLELDSEEPVLKLNVPVDPLIELTTWLL